MDQNIVMIQPSNIDAKLTEEDESANAEMRISTMTIKVKNMKEDFAYDDVYGGF